jgi:DNA primase
MLAQIPDGAFGDLMKQQLAQLTGSAATPRPPRADAATPAAADDPARGQAQPGARRDRRAAAAAVAGADAGRQAPLPGPAPARRGTAAGAAGAGRTAPGHQHRRPAGTLRRREEQASLHTLAAQTLPGTEASWTQELHDAVAQLEKQLLVQRLEELLAKQRQQGLDDTDKYELRELLKARAGLRL